MTTPIDLSKPHRRLRAGVILVNSKTEVLDVAPLDIFALLSKGFLHNFPQGLLTDKMREEALDVDFYWVNETGDHTNLSAGISLRPTHTFETCPPLDTVLMGASDAEYTISDAEAKFIRKCYDECAAFLTICGRFLSALQAGILRDKTATSLRPLVDQLRQSNPEVNWVSKRWVRDGKLWTSGALLNGTDMMAAFVTEYWGGRGLTGTPSSVCASVPIREEMLTMLMSLGSYETESYKRGSELHSIEMLPRDANH